MRSLVRRPSLLLIVATTTTAAVTTASVLLGLKLVGKPCAIALRNWSWEKRARAARGAAGGAVAVRSLLQKARQRLLLVIVHVLGLALTDIAERRTMWQLMHAPHAKRRQRLPLLIIMVVVTGAELAGRRSLSFLFGRLFAAGPERWLAHAPYHYWRGFRSEGANVDGVGALVGSCRGDGCGRHSTALPLVIGLGAVVLVHRVAGDCWENLDVRDLRQLAADNLISQQAHDALNFLRRVSRSTLLKQPVGDGIPILTATKVAGIVVAVVGCCSERSLLGNLILKSLLFPLPDGKRPVRHDTIAAGRLVRITPFLHTLDLLLDQLNLQLRIILGVPVTTALVVLSAIVDPHVCRNLPRAELVATKDVRNCLSQLGARVAIFHVHANNGLGLFLAGQGRSSVDWLH